MRRSPCKWVSWDEDGRPSCVHGPAFKRTDYHVCRLKHLAANDAYRKRTGYASDRKYDASEKGQEASRRSNQQESTKSRKALYELTRIRIS